MLLDLTVCLVRDWRLDDAEALARRANDRRIWINLRDRFPHPYTPADARAFLAHVRESRPRTAFAIVIDGEAVGGVAYTLHDDVERISAELGYWLAVPFWGRGVATAVVSGFTPWVFHTHQELRRIYAVPFARNAASARVLEKAGYRLEGLMRESAIKDGVVNDQLLYAIRRSEALAG
jgi:RimJ/RimL family protein N-acetyltransferase